MTSFSLHRKQKSSLSLCGRSAESDFRIQFKEKNRTKGASHPFPAERPLFSIPVRFEVHKARTPERWEPPESNKPVSLHGKHRNFQSLNFLCETQIHPLQGELEGHLCTCPGQRG